MLVHMASLPKPPLAELLRPWLESTTSLKVLCDTRADADALQHIYAIRLRGIVDVQLCHAAATGALPRRAAADTAAGAAAGAEGSAAPFFFPTGLSRLAATYCSRELSAPLAALKTDFNGQFDAGKSPFRELPLTAAAATYAAADVWHAFLVYEALWPQLEAAGSALQVVAASEARACEFRDVADGRERWAAAMAQHKAAKTASGGAKAAVRGAKRLPRADAADAAAAAGGEPGAAGEGPQASAAAAAAAAAAEAEAAPPPPVIAPDGRATRPTKQKISGPACECCNVCFSGIKQLEEHRQGKRHAQAAEVARAPTALPLRIECRQMPLEPTAVTASFAQYGDLDKVQLASPTPPDAAAAAAGSDGPWFATVVYKEPAAAARAVGQNKLYVGGKRVYVEVVK